MAPTYCQYTPSVQTSRDESSLLHVCSGGQSDRLIYDSGVVLDLLIFTW